MEDITQSNRWRLVFGSDRTDMSDSSKQARDHLLRLISESMEARMQNLEALQRLQSTMKAIQQLSARSRPGRLADKLDKQFF